MFKLENITLLYDTDKIEKTYALNQINMEIKEGRTYSILGPSGSGKSSLLYVISGIKQATAGKLYYRGQNMNLLEEAERSELRRKEFGFVFQQYFLIPYMNILNNVLVPINSNKKEDRERAIGLLEAFGLAKYMDKKPNELSGGQCQRVAIARALINEPKVIFADEITASLDQKNAEHVIQILYSLKNNATILFVTHDVAMTGQTDEIIYMRDGKIGGDLGESS